MGLLRRAGVLVDYGLGGSLEPEKQCHGSTQDDGDGDGERERRGEPPDLAPLDVKTQQSTAVLVDGAYGR